MENIKQNDSENILGVIRDKMDELIVPDDVRKTLEFVVRLVEVTQKSLMANKQVLESCYRTEPDGHVMCVFCNDGIPHWKDEHSREHRSECPINPVTGALNATKTLKKALEARNTNNESINNDQV